MDANRQVEVHYIDTGFPFTVTQSFMDLFEGLTYAQADVVLAEALQDQGNLYWSMMHTSSYKYGYSGSGSNPYYSFSNAYEINDYAPRLDGERRLWENSAPSNGIDSPQIVVHGIGTAGTSSDSSTNHSTAECIRTNQNSNSPHGIFFL